MPSRPFNIAQVAYYEDRFYELERDQLLQVAAELGTAYAGRPNLERSELNDAIAGAMGPGEASTSDVLRCRDRLTDLGYFWHPPGTGGVWQPGIPSLMDYVREHRRPVDQPPLTVAKKLPRSACVLPALAVTGAGR